MPSALHEALIELFRQRPSLAAELLGEAFGMGVPDFGSARLEPGEFADLAPTEYRADAVVVLTAGAASVFAVVVEVQLRRHPRKRWSWPVYLATLRARLECPAALLVVCVDEPTARWCATPIPLGHPGLTLRPLVLGPAEVPVLTDLDEARRTPELAVLSAMAHGADPEHSGVLDALLRTLADIDPDRANLYYDVVLAALPLAARRHLEELMPIGTYEYQSDFARRYFFQGKAEGIAEGHAEGIAEGQAAAKAEAVLAVLDARGIDVPADARARITGCSDIDRLDAWVRRAITAGSVQELLD